MVGFVLVLLIARLSGFFMVDNVGNAEMEIYYDVIEYSGEVIVELCGVLPG